MRSYIIAISLCNMLLGCQAEQDSLTEFISSLQTHAEHNPENRGSEFSFTPLRYQASTLPSPFAPPLGGIKLASSSVQPCTASERPQRRTLTVGEMPLKGIMGQGKDRVAVVEISKGKWVQLGVGQPWVAEGTRGVIAVINQENIVVEQEMGITNGCLQTVTTFQQGVVQ